MEQLFLKGNFNLRQTKVANKITPIYYVISINGKQYKFATGVKVICSQWNKEKQQALESNKLSNADNRNNKVANEVIEKYKDSLAQYLEYLSVNTNEIPNYQTLKRFIYMKTNASPIDVFTSAFEKSIKRQTNQGTISQYTNYYNSFVEFIKDKSEMTVFNQYSINDYKNYLIDKNGSATAINRKVGFVVSIINNVLCVESEYLHLNLHPVTYNKLSDKRTREEIGRFPLSESEVLEIANLEINETDTYTFKDVAPKNEDGKVNNKYGSKIDGKKLKEYRDIFVLQCDCGQRISDTKQFIKGNYTVITNNGNTYFEIKTKKSRYKQSAFIRKTAIVESFLETYKDGFTVNIDKLDNADSYYNVSIRKLCQLANINRIIEYTDSKNVSHKVPLYQKITSHDARHTFITNMVIKGFSPDVLCWMTGHNDDTMIKTIYTHLTKDDKLNGITKELNKIDNKTIKKDGLQVLFAYDELKKVQSEGYNTPSAKIAISKIKDISELSNYDTIDKEKVLELEPIVFFLAYYNKDMDLYRTFEFKMKYFGIIDKFSSLTDNVERLKDHLKKNSYFNTFTDKVDSIKTMEFLNSLFMENQENEIKDYLERT